MITFDDGQTVSNYGVAGVYDIAISCDGSILMYTADDLYIYDRLAEVSEPFIYTSSVIFFVT